MRCIWNNFGTYPRFPREAPSGNKNLYLSFIFPERGGFGEIFPEVMIFPEARSDDISPNPPSGGSINDILYRKSKTSVRINF